MSTGAEIMLADVREVLRLAGVSDMAVADDPAGALHALLTEHSKADWRDAFLAALAGGHSVRMAHAMADEAEQLMRERWTEQAVKS